MERAKTERVMLVSIFLKWFLLSSYLCFSLNVEKLVYPLIFASIKKQVDRDAYDEQFSSSKRLLQIDHSVAKC